MSSKLCPYVLMSDFLTKEFTVFLEGKHGDVLP